MGRAVRCLLRLPEPSSPSSAPDHSSSSSLCSAKLGDVPSLREYDGELMLAVAVGGESCAAMGFGVMESERGREEAEELGGSGGACGAGAANVTPSDLQCHFSPSRIA